MVFITNIVIECWNSELIKINLYCNFPVQDPDPEDHWWPNCNVNYKSLNPRIKQVRMPEQRGISYQTLVIPILLYFRVILYIKDCIYMWSSLIIRTLLRENTYFWPLGLDCRVINFFKTILGEHREAKTIIRAKYHGYRIYRAGGSWWMVVSFQTPFSYRELETTKNICAMFKIYGHHGHDYVYIPYLFNFIRILYYIFMGFKVPEIYYCSMS